MIRRSPCGSAALRVGAALLALGVLGCTGVYYDAMDSVLGKQKRHILSDRVRASQAEQAAVEEEFKTTLDLFKEVTGFEGGELEGFYERMNAQYERSENRADTLRARIRSIERVASDLFDEWDTEIGEISSASMRRSSEQSLRETRTRYGQMIGAMKRAEKKMDPVLIAFRDQVLFLKHNLNASAIASLEGTRMDIQRDIDALIRDMRAAIAESERFLAAMPS